MQKEWKYGGRIGKGVDDERNRPEGMRVEGRTKNRSGEECVNK